MTVLKLHVRDLDGFLVAILVDMIQHTAKERGQETIHQSAFLCSVMNHIDTITFLF